MSTLVSCSRRYAIGHDTLWVVVVVLVGTVLRFYRLDAQSLWADEGIQYTIASANTLWEVVERARYGTFHPPLSFLINHLFLRLSDSDFFLRLPSVLFGIGSLPLAYVLARKVMSKSAAVWTLLVLALSPFHIWYSQEARMYAPLLFASLLSTLLLLEALERRTLAWWASYAGVTALGLFLHIFMVVHVMAHVLWMLLYHRRALLTYLMSGVVAAVLAFPVLMRWIGIFLREVSTQGSGRAIGMAAGDRIAFSWEAIPYTFYVYGTGLSFGPSVAELHANRSVEFLVQFLPHLLAVGLICGTLLVLGVLVMPKNGSWASWWLCLLGLAVPIGAVALFTWVSRSSFNVRYTIVAYPYFCILLGVALAFLSRKNRWVMALAVVALMGLATVSLANHFGQDRYAKADVRAAVAFWRSASMPDEYLLSCSPAGGVHQVVHRYVEGAERERHVPLGGRQIVNKVQSFFAAHETPFVYIVVVRDWYKRRENAIRESFDVHDEQSFPGVRVMKIARR